MDDKKPEIPGHATSEPAAHRDVTSKPTIPSDTESKLVTLNDVKNTIVTEINISSENKTEHGNTNISVTQRDTTCEIVTQSDTSNKFVTQTDTTNNPAKRTDTTCEPASQTDTVDKPISQSDTTSTTVDESDTTCKPVILSNTTRKPVIQSDNTSKAVTQSDNTSKPVTQSDTTSKLVNQSDTTSKPVTQSDNTSKPGTQSDTTSKLVTQSDTTSKPVTQSDTTSKLVNQSDTTSKPGTQSDPTSKPVTQSDTTSKPVTQSDNTSKPVTQSDTTSKPVTRSDTTSKPVTRSDTTSKPVTQSDTTSKPVTQSDPTSKPVTQRDTISKPVAQSDVTSKHVTLIDTTRNPVTQSDTTSYHVTQSDTTSYPVTQSDTTSKHVTQSDTTSKPVTQSDTTSYPVTQSDTTSKHVTQSDTTSYPVTQSDTTSYPVTQSDTTSKHVTQTDTTSYPVTQSDTTSYPVTQSDTTSKHVTQSDTTINHVNQNDTSSKLASKSNTTDCMVKSQACEDKSLSVDETKSSHVDDIKKINPVSSTNTGTKSGIVKVLTGICSFEEVPPLPKKIVRIFFSSTFTDTKEERNALMQYVYPKLSKFCREKHGLEFQVVDMRWGVPQAASDNHSTTELCIQEIKKCQEVSVGPNFVAIVGDKYGYRPIPSHIKEPLFNKLQLHSTHRPDHASEQSDWALVAEWYLRDDNAVPSVYILQPISVKIPHYSDTEQSDLRKQAQNKWNEVNQTLTLTLRQAAEGAFKDMQLTQDEKDMFFISVTENEIHEGLLGEKNKLADTCFCIIRKITDLPQYLQDPKAPRFADIKEQKFDNEARELLQNLRESKLSANIPKSNLSNYEIEWLASGAKVSIDKFRDIDIAKFVQESLQHHEGQVIKYKTYLEDVCTQFFDKVSQLIDEGGMQEKQLYDELSSEVLQHWHLAKNRCEVFEGRGDIMSVAEDYLKDSDKPLTIYGNSGCGKTSVVAKVMENVANGNWKSKTGSQYFIIARFLGTTPNTSNVNQLLITICQQIAIMYGFEWEAPEKFSDIVKSFHKLLENASDNKPLLLMLDSVDQLMPAYNAFKLGWLPLPLPNHVKLIISTINEGYPILNHSIERYGSEMKIVEVKSLGEKLGLEVINKWLRKDSRKMTEQQTSVIKLALQQCSLPLYTRIAYDQVKKWKSYDVPKIEELETTVRGSINKLFESLEEKFGIDIVKHSLSYLTASRYGLSEAELEHLLSLDDMLLNKVFVIWNPPIRRIPPLLWTRIRTEIHSYLVERSADDTLVLYWYHRQFIEATQEKYLKDQEFSKHVHFNLTEYFTGKWGGGREKYFEYTEAQMKRFGFKTVQSKADRKVPEQPYIIQQGDGGTRYNKRKLSELPFHLFKCKEYKELKRLVFFNYEWLYAKLCSSSAQQLLEEFEIFIQADKIMKRDVEMRNLYANLQLIRPYITRFPNSLAYELTGRLAKFIDQSTAIALLLEGCDTLGRKHCPIVPLVTSFETADVGLSQNITFRKAEPWQRGVFTCSPDFKTMYIIDYDDGEEGLPKILVYDIATAEKVNSLQITKARDEKTYGKNIVDEYIQIDLTIGGTHMLGFYVQNYDDGYSYSDVGLVDLIDLQDGNVLWILEGSSYKHNYHTPLQYMTESYLCVRFGRNFTLYNVGETKTSKQTKKEFQKPSLLSPDEQYFIICEHKKTELREFSTNQLIGDFDIAEMPIAITTNKDFSFVTMMGSETKQIKRFDLGKRQLHTNKMAGYVLKYKKCFELESKVATLVADLFKPVIEYDLEGRKLDKTSNRVVLNIAPNNKHLLVVFEGTDAWVAYVWNLFRWNAKSTAPITNRMPIGKNKFPLFSYDGSCIAYSKGKEILVYSTADAKQINKFEMADDVIDFYMSQTSNKIAVMQTKSVVLLNLAKSNASITSKGIRLLNKTSVVLIEREINTSYIHKEVTITQLPGAQSNEVQELEDIGMAVSTDRLASARSKVRFAIDKKVTPDGLKVVHHHTRVQVVDTKTEKIVYTPKKGEMILRVVENSSGPSTNKTVNIPGLEAGEKGPRISVLLQGDRIVNETNKVKFRVNQEPSGQFKIMNVPSIITVYSAEEEKLRKLSGITVYQEKILTVSNNFCVTSKKTINSNFIKIYYLNSGRDVATHEVEGGCTCAKFSFNEEQLFTIDQNVILRVYLAPGYQSVEQKMQLIQMDEVFPVFAVKDILTFKKNREIIVIKYNIHEGISTKLQSRYIHVNLASKEKSQEMELQPCFEDVSKDGNIGIDARLSVYKLSEGKVVTKVEYSGISNEKLLKNNLVGKISSTDPTAKTKLLVRMSSNGRYIVYVDKKDDTLHIAEMINGKISPLFSCHTHVPNLALSHGLELRHYRRIIVLRTGDSIKPFAIMDEKIDNLSYENETSRALSIVDNIWATSTNHKLPNLSRQAANRMFLRKYDLREEAEDEVVDDEEEKKVKSSTKPSILIIGESILSQLEPYRFSAHLTTQLILANTAVEAIKTVQALTNTYDAIVLQLITDDVKSFDTKSCIDKVRLAVSFAKMKSSVVVISLAPNRLDYWDLNQKTEEINEQVKIQCVDPRGIVYFCDNSNLSKNGKPIREFFETRVYLTRTGLEQISVNIKEVLRKALQMDII